MKWKTAVISLVIIGAVAGAIWLRRARTAPPVTVTLRLNVTPPEQVAFVTRQANGARFKYLVGKKSGVKPLFAQQLSIKPLANTSLLQAQVGVQTKSDGERYADAFMEILQSECGSQAAVTLSTQSIR
jgi:hypothetical protein